MKPNSKPTRLTYEEIKFQLKQKDIYLSDIAVALKVSRSHAYQIASGRAKSKRVAEAISRCLGLTLEQVFADEYTNVSRDKRDQRRKQIAAVINTPLTDNANSLA
ncbi:helix-turn-helix domain-containing protein [Pseudoalteromonas 'SMAR']|uniref:helix-turn-helix domain-containing protein n=1 Tax=Pseudoalteromonas 'SMAR' TaxID=3416908 RepID=UPI003AF2409D